MKGVNLQTPGVYVNEVNAFPNSVVAMPTAVPAFIGYTARASYKGKSYTNVPVKITSFADFKTFYCYPDPPSPAPAAKQFNPQYYLVKQKSQPLNEEWIEIDGAIYSIVPDPNTIYYLYNSVRLFYANGGADAYIVSVGTYGNESKNSITPGDALINPNVQLNDLLYGLSLLDKEQEPTMYVCPEATLLSVTENGTLMRAMLLQCSRLQTAISIFDIIGGRNPDSVLYTNDIATFRNETGNAGLSYGAAYYPFIDSNVVEADEIDYSNFFENDFNQLAAIINPASNSDPAVAKIIAAIKDPNNKLTVAETHSSLLKASPIYAAIVKKVLAGINILPASGAMAGIITLMDNSIGAWHAPANVSIVCTASLPINLTNNQQEDLNVDPVSGKSINAIRSFIGKGTLVWGARTLDGNSQDFKYISVRRTMIFLEQSCKFAALAYVFEPNDQNTWQSIKSMVSSFLNNVWKQGGLQGSKAEEAYSVQCGLGTTMTAGDISNGILNITILVAISRPSEFILITIQQQQKV